MDFTVRITVEVNVSTVTPEEAVAVAREQLKARLTPFSYGVARLGSVDVLDTDGDQVYAEMD